MGAIAKAKAICPYCDSETFHIIIYPRGLETAACAACGAAWQGFSWQEWEATDRGPRQDPDGHQAMGSPRHEPEDMATSTERKTPEPRLTYMRELMRRKRAAQKAKQDPDPKP